MSTLPFLGISDPFSATTHCLGALGAAALALPLVRRATTNSGGRKYIWVFCVSVVFLLTMSGCYHWLTPGSASRAVLQRLDHAGIFMLIAGTFTAGHGLLFRGFWRNGMIALIWAVGIAGVVAKLAFFDDISETTGLMLYLAMGWLAAASMVKLLMQRNFRSAAYLGAGGLVYTVGAAGDHLGQVALTLAPGVFGAHELFHLAVLGGIAIHWKLFHDAAVHVPFHETRRATSGA